MIISDNNYSGNGNMYTEQKKAGSTFSSSRSENLHNSVVQGNTSMTAETASGPMGGISPDELAKQVLKSAGMSANAKNIEIVNTLLRNTMPINHDSIRTLLSQSAAYPDIDTDTLALMNRNSIPVNADSVATMKEFLAHGQIFSDSISSVIDSLDLLFSASDTNPELKESITQLLTDTVYNSVVAQSASSEDAAELLASLRQTFAGTLEFNETDLNEFLNLDIDTLSDASVSDITSLSDASVPDITSLSDASGTTMSSDVTVGVTDVPVASDFPHALQTADGIFDPTNTAGEANFAVNPSTSGMVADALSHAPADGSIINSNLLSATNSSTTASALSAENSSTAGLFSAADLSNADLLSAAGSPVADNIATATADGSVHIYSQFDASQAYAADGLTQLDASQAHAADGPTQFDASQAYAADGPTQPFTDIQTANTGISTQLNDLQSTASGISSDAVPTGISGTDNPLSAGIDIAQTEPTARVIGSNSVIDSADSQAVITGNNSQADITGNNSQTVITGNNSQAVITGNNSQSGIADLNGQSAALPRNLSSNTALYENISAQIKKLIDGKDSRAKSYTDIRNMLKTALSMKPEEISRPTVKSLYSRASLFLSKLDELTSSINDNAPAKDAGLQSKTAQALKNLEELKDINSIYPHVEIPLQTKDGKGNAALYVYSKAKQNVRSSDNVTALLHLTMPNLGLIDIHLSLRKHDLNIKFYSGSDSLALLKDSFGSLNDRLSELSYMVSSAFSDSSASNPAEELKEALSANEPQNPAFYSFDTKA